MYIGRTLNFIRIELTFKYNVQFFHCYITVFALDQPSNMHLYPHFQKERNERMKYQFITSQFFKFLQIMIEMYYH